MGSGASGRYDGTWGAGGMADQRAAAGETTDGGSVASAIGRVKELLRDESGHVSFGRGREIWLPRDEYAMVMSELNMMYDARLKGAVKPVDVPILNHVYSVEVYGKGEYRIIGREELE